MPERAKLPKGVRVEGETGSSDKIIFNKNDSHREIRGEGWAPPPKKKSTNCILARTYCLTNKNLERGGGILRPNPLKIKNCRCEIKIKEGRGEKWKAGGKSHSNHGNYGIGCTEDLF